MGMKCPNCSKKLSCSCEIKFVNGVRCCASCASTVSVKTTAPVKGPTNVVRKILNLKQSLN